MDHPEFPNYPPRGGDAPPVRRGNGPLDRSLFPSHPHTPRPTPQAHADALAVVHSPELVFDQPRLRLDAWAALLAERGRTMRPVRVAAMQHRLGHITGMGAFLLNPAAINGGR